MVRPAALVFCLFFAFSAVFVRPAARAGQCADGPCCNQEDIQGPIIFPDHNENGDGTGDMNLGGFTVLSGVLAIGQALRDGSNKTAAAMDKNFEAQDAYMRQVLTGLGSGMERAENMEMFGPDSRGYNTDQESAEFGSDIQSGLSANAQLSERLRGDIHSYSRKFDTRSDILERIRDAPSGNELKNGDTMSPEELAAAREWAKTVLEPFPALNLAENIDESRMAEGYESTRKARDSRLIIPTAVISDLIASRAPVIDLGAWPEKMHGKMGGKDAPARVSGGKLSVNGLAGMLTDMRFANQEWMDGENGIHGMTKTGVLREILMARADRLMLEYQRMLWLDRMAALMAQKQLSRSKELGYVLEDARENLFR